VPLRLAVAILLLPCADSAAVAADAVRCTVLLATRIGDRYVLSAPFDATTRSTQQEQAMGRRTTFTAILLTGFLISAGPVRAQLPAPNAAGVSAGHMHMMVRDPAAHKKIWVELFGAQVVNSGSLELLKFPGIFLILGRAEAANGSEGSTLDHFAFRVKDIAGTSAKLKAAGIPLTRDDSVELVAIFPDKVKVEFYAAPTLAVPIEHFHAHFYAADVDGLRAWYAKHFGAAMPTATNANAMGVPGISFSFRKTDAPQAATKGRSLDHIGFEVRDLDAFTKKLAADGVVLESPLRDVPAIGLKIAFLIDPAGTRIELTQGLAGR
jgi:catechol 2,3-dioxygenase-like lactoylglutathione lyase family enzyme